MALQIHPSLYTGGAERFNSRPSIALYANLMARQQAKEDAYDEYIRSLNKNVNPAGMRNQERQVFDEKLAEWQKFGMENRDAIRKRTGGVDMEFQRKYQDLLNTIQESKTEEERKKPAIELLLDPNKRDRIDEDGFMRDITSHDAPLYIKDSKGQWVRNPDRRSLDFTGFSFNPKMMETEDWRKYDEAMDKAFPADKTNTNISPHPKDKFTNLVTTAKVYSPDKLKGIGDAAINDYESDRRLNYSFRKTHPFKEWKEEHEAQFSELNAAFQKAYPGRNISNESELFAATQIQRKLAPTVEEKTEANWEARDSRNFAQQKELKALDHAYSVSEIKLREQLGQTSAANATKWIDGHVKGLIDKANAGNTSQTFEINGNRFTEKRLPNDPVLRNAFKNGNDIIPDYITVTSDGKLRPVFLRPPTPGQPPPPKGHINYDPIISQPVELESVKLLLGKTSGVKHLNEEMSGNAGGAPASTTQTTEVSTKEKRPLKVKQNGVVYNWNEKTQTYEPE
jgi:hypothetical protein